MEIGLIGAVVVDYLPRQLRSEDLGLRFLGDEEEGAPLLARCLQ